MVELIHGLRAEDVRLNLERVHERLDAAGRKPGEVQILAAVKYLAVEELQALADGGITLVGENRAQELVTKAEAYPEFTWDFIGALQSRKVRDRAAVRALHPLGCERFRPPAAGQARNAGHPDPDRGECRR